MKIVTIFLTFISLTFSAYGSIPDLNNQVLKSEVKELTVDLNTPNCEKLVLDQVKEELIVAKVRLAIHKIIDAARLYLHAYVRHHGATVAGNPEEMSGEVEIMGNQVGDVYKNEQTAAGEVALAELWTPEERVPAFHCVIETIQTVRNLLNLYLPGIPD